MVSPFQKRFSCGVRRFARCKSAENIFINFDSNLFTRITWKLTEILLRIFVPEER
jgi:hypothetical protein